MFWVLGLSSTVASVSPVRRFINRSTVSAGKVCARHWYDKSKHIFPASRWEVYDPEKDYSNYTVK